jgi:putative intracellular protease/amidase
MIQWTSPSKCACQLVADKPTSREEPKMKRASLIMLLVVSLVLSIGVSQKSVSTESNNRVLLILREQIYTSNKQYMNTTEAFVMKSMLAEAGFKVVIASASGRTFLHGDIILESDLKLAEVKTAAYVGFIIPCMNLVSSTLKPEEMAIAKQVVAEGKPVAAQRWGVVMLAQAGAFAGKRYSYDESKGHNLRFDKAIYSGKGVVQDGNILTTAYCPEWGPQDQTVELTKALIAELQK